MSVWEWFKWEYKWNRKYFNPVVSFYRSFKQIARKSI